MSASSEVQKLIYDTLTADLSLMAIVTGIYDGMPSDGFYPCVTFGPADSPEDDAEGLTAWSEYIQLHVWSQDHGQMKICKDLVHLVRTALHEQPLVLPDPYALVQIRVPTVRVSLDPDGTTAHGVVDVAAMVDMV